MLFFNFWYLLLLFFNLKTLFKNPFINFSNHHFLEKFIFLFFYRFYNKNVIFFRRNLYPHINFYFFKLYSYSYDFNFLKLIKFFSKITNVNFSKFNFFFYFLKKNFFNFFNFLIFKKLCKFSLIKILFLTFLIFKRCYFFKKSYAVKFLNLNNFIDWYKYTANVSKSFFLKKLIKFDNRKYNFFKKNYIKIFFKIYVSYTLKYKSIFKNLNVFYKNIFSLLNFVRSRFILRKIFLKSGGNFITKFSNTSLNKFINLNNIENYFFLFLRKIKYFNKSRYSRNRQTYRTGVYWCLWFNILSVYGLYFIFYRFTFNFSFLWLPFIIFIGSFIFSRFLKYNLISFNSLKSELFNLFIWWNLIFYNFFLSFKKILFKCFSYLLNLIYFLKLNSIVNFFNQIIFENFLMEWRILNLK